MSFLLTLDTPGGIAISLDKGATNFHKNPVESTCSDEL
jgi:hypothetical protein